MIDEWKITREPASSRNDAGRRDGVKHNADLYALPAILKFEDSQHCLIKGALSLHDVVVH